MKIAGAWSSSIRALRSIIIVSLNRLMVIILAYFNHKNNRYNNFVKPYWKD